MISFLPDDRQDLIWARLNRLQALPRWTAEKHRLKKGLEHALKAFGYEGQHFDAGRYPVTRIGQSALVQVQSDQRGLLEPYRGQCVRLVCMGGCSRRTWLMVGVMKPEIRAGSNVTRRRLLSLN